KRATAEIASPPPCRRLMLPLEAESRLLTVAAQAGTRVLRSGGTVREPRRSPRDRLLSPPPGWRPLPTGRGTQGSEFRISSPTVRRARYADHSTPRRRRPA